MSLTAHWLNSDLKQNHAVLHVQEFDGSHTGEAIKEICFRNGVFPGLGSSTFFLYLIT